MKSRQLTSNNMPFEPGHYNSVCSRESLPKILTHRAMPCDGIAARK
jgi:hypothetical protein